MQNVLGKYPNLLIEFSGNVEYNVTLQQSLQKYCINMMRATSIQQNVKTAGKLGGFSIFATLHKVLIYNNITFIYRVGVQSTNGINLYADFDMNKGLATLYDAEGNVLRQDSISENAKAMFTTIDPTGKDWYQNNQTSYYTWYDGDGEREGFTHIGGQRNEKGEI